MVTSLIVAFKSSSMQVLRVVGHDIRFAVREDSSSELWIMSAIVVKRLANRCKVLVLFARDAPDVLNTKSTSLWRLLSSTPIIYLE